MQRKSICFIISGNEWNFGTLWRHQTDKLEKAEIRNEDNVEGKVTDEWFLQLSYKYEVERMELKEKIAELRGSISDLDSM